jgi:hypothetical protein
LRLALYEAGRPTPVAEIRRDFVVQNGQLRAAVQVEAAPGEYELRIVTQDKTRRPMSQAATFTVPGIRREPGWWLFNGSPFVASSNGTEPATSPNAPLFIAGLKRDLNPKAKPISRNIYSSSLLAYRVLELPSLSEMTLGSYDFTALKTEVAALVNKARASGQRDLVGFELPIGRYVLPSTANKVATTTARIRQIVNEVVPEAALILNVEASDSVFQTQRLEECVPLCDAVVLSSGVDVWSIKVLRRIAEEQPNYDLPIFVSVPRAFTEEDRTLSFDENFDVQAANTRVSTMLFHSLMSGATGLVEYSNQAQDTWRRVVARNTALFAGSVTIEDLGVLTSPDWKNNSEGGDPNNTVFNSSYLSRMLHDAGRIPLAARLPDLSKREKERKYESLVVSLGDHIVTPQLTD